MNPTKSAVTLSPNTVVANISYAQTKEVHPLSDENGATIYSCQNSANSDGRVLCTTMTKTHYYYSNLIWRTVSRQVDEVVLLYVFHMKI